MTLDEVTLPAEARPDGAELEAAAAEVGDDVGITERPHDGARGHRLVR